MLLYSIKSLPVTYIQSKKKKLPVHAVFWPLNFHEFSNHLWLLETNVGLLKSYSPQVTQKNNPLQITNYMYKIVIRLLITSSKIIALIITFKWLKLYIYYMLFSQKTFWVFC